MPPANLAANGIEGEIDGRVQRAMLDFAGLEEMKIQLIPNHLGNFHAESDDPKRIVHDPVYQRVVYVGPV